MNSPPKPDIGSPADRGSRPAAGCPFCDVREELAVARSDHGHALRDGHPISEGHTLIIPREHVESIFDLSPSALADLWELVDRVRRSLVAEFGTNDFTIGVNDGPLAGQTVSHAHVHVIPRRRGDVADPRGGIRWVVPERAAYWEQ